MHSALLMQSPTHYRDYDYSTKYAEYISFEKSKFGGMWIDFEVKTGIFILNFEWRISHILILDNRKRAPNFVKTGL